MKETILPKYKKLKFSFTFFILFIVFAFLSMLTLYNDILSMALSGMSMIFLFLSILSYPRIRRNLKFGLTKKHKVILFLVMVIISFDIIICNDKLYDDSQCTPSFIFLILSYILSFILFMLCIGVILFLTMSYPPFLLILLDTFWRIINFRYSIQLKEVSGKFIFDESLERVNKLNKGYIFSYFFLELLFVSSVISILIPYTYVPGFRSLLLMLDDFKSNKQLFLLFVILLLLILTLYTFLFSLSVTGFKWNEKPINTSIFHQVLSFTALAAFIVKMVSLEKVWEVGLSVGIYAVYIFGLSFGFLAILEYSKGKLRKYLVSTSKEYPFLEIRKNPFIPCRME